ncbi:hypothetical protein SAMN05444278_1145, partial [Psychroflexus salarius]
MLRLTHFIFSIFLFSSFFGFSQTLTISNSGETGTSGNNWSVSGSNPITITATGTANINTTVIEGYLANGDLIIEAANITVDAAVNSPTANSWFLEANSNVVQTANGNITTQGGALVIRADANGDNEGRVELRGNITTNGGPLYVGGGSSSESLGGLSVPAGNAISTNNTQHGVLVNGANINTGGGNLRVRGQNTAVDGTNTGVMVMNSSIETAAGDVSISGKRSGNPNRSAGLMIGTQIAASASTGNVSISSTTGDITLEGVTEANAAFSWAHGLAFVLSGGDDLSISSTAGNISLLGDATNAALQTGEAVGIVVQLDNGNYTSAQFNVSTDGGAVTWSGLSAYTGGDDGLALRAQAVTGDGSVTIGDANTGDITFMTGSLQTPDLGARAITIESAGAVVFEGPTGANFAADINISDEYNFASSITSLRLGKTDNTSTNISLNTPVSISGPVSIYADELSIAAGINTSSGNGNILLQGTTSVTTNGSDRSLNSGSGDISILTDAVMHSGTDLVINSTGSFTFAPITNWTSAFLGGSFLGFNGSFSGSNFIGNNSQPETQWLQINNMASLGGLTLGRLGSTNNLQMNSSFSVAGPIRLYGQQVLLDANLTTTASSGTGVLIEAQRILQDDGFDVTTSGADISYTTSGYVTPDSDERTLIAIKGDGTDRAIVNANGGNITIAGSYAAGGAGDRTTRAIEFSIADLITSGTGAISLTGDASNVPSTTQSAWGMQPNDARIITENGAITLDMTGGAASGNSRGMALDNQNMQLLSESGTITIRDLKPNGLTGTWNGLYVLPASENGFVLGADGTNVSSSSADILIETDKLFFTTRSSDFNTSGSITIAPISSSFASNWNDFRMNISSSATGLTFGKPGNNASKIEHSRDISINGPINIYSYDITSNAKLEAVNDRISLISGGANNFQGTLETLSGANIIADELVVRNFHRAYVGYKSPSFVGTVAVNKFASDGGDWLFVNNSKALAIENIAGVDGVSVSGFTRLYTESQDLSINAPVASSLSSGTAIQLFADRDATAGQAGDGNIKIANNGAVNTESGARALLYSGNVASSTGVLGEVGGEANTRSQVDANTDLNSISPALGSSGIYALFRVGTGEGDLTIVASGGDAEGSTWTFDSSSNTLTTISSLADVNASVVEDYLASGDLTIEAGNITINAALTSIANNDLILNSDGYIDTKENVALGGSFVADTKRNVLLRDNKTISTSSANSKVLLKTEGDGTTNGNGYISLGNQADITTNGGDIILWSNAANRSSGIANNEVYLAQDNTLNSNGGSIVIAGGLDDGSNGGTINDGIPDGYAYRGGQGSEAIRLRTNVNLLSDGGDIILRGRQNGSDYAVGIEAGVVINSGAGTINIDGQNTGNHAIDMAQGNFAITSASTAQTAITISGTTTGTDNTTSAGMVISFNAASGHSLIQTTGASGGGIVLQAINGGDGKALWLGNNDPASTLQILSNTGDISLISNGIIELINHNVYLGNRKDATAIQGITPAATSASGDVTLTTLGIYGAGFNTTDGVNRGKIHLSTAGVFTLEPYTNAFGGYYLAGNLSATGGQLDFGGAYDSGTNTATGNGAESTWLITNNADQLGGIVLGKEGMTQAIALYEMHDINGPISVYAGNITLNDHLRSTASGSDILLKSSGNITHGSNKNIITNNGDIILWADSDANNEGFIAVGNNVTFNTANGSTASGLSGGGAIVLAGGADDGANGGVASDGLPDGFARSASNPGIELSTDNTGDVNFYSGGGNITMHGYSSNNESPNVFNNNGINQFGGLFIDAGTGRIRMIGEGVNLYGINLNQGSAAAELKLTLTSAATSGDAIYIRGVSSSSLGLVFNFSSNKELKATAGGDITLEGVGGGSSQGIFLQTIDVLANKGTITLDGGTNGIFNKNTANTYGFKAGSDITSSSSDIIFRGNAISVEGGGTATSFNTTGTVTLEPYGTSFTSVLSFPISNLSLDASVSGLTLGKASNTAAITIAGATTIAGPITAYGGTITLNADLTTTNNGDISLYTNNPLGLTTSRTLTAAGAFKYIPRGTAFTADVTYPITNLAATNTGLTIGNATNDKDITINADVIGDAGIELFGNDIDINANLETTNSANLAFKGNATIAAGQHIASNGNFIHDGDLLFKSDATNGDAYLGSIDGTYTKTSGTVITEKYYPAKRAFRLVSSPVDGGSLFDNWQNSGANDAGLGTHITGEVGTVGEYNATTGIDYTASGNPSLFGFSTANGWEAITDTKNTNLEAGVPYRL